jgi:SnoaL-like polyketide cyclase
VVGGPRRIHEVLDLIGEGDKVAAGMPLSGTQTGQVLELAATGRRVHVGEMVIFRIIDGKIVEVWEEWDELGMRQQLGVVPVPSLDSGPRAPPWVVVPQPRLTKGASR